MVKILSRTGDSLADMYDVEGSISGIEHLETHTLPIMHEMGGTVFSERLGAAIRRNQTSALAQNAVWDIVSTDLPNVPFRVLGVCVLADAAARTQFAQLSLRESTNGREVPFFSWFTTNDVESDIRIVENGAAVSNVIKLVGPTQLPTLGMGDTQRQHVGELTFRGLTAAFGAGTVTLTALVHIAFAQTGGISSRGVPIPGW